jgi:hypothetical protein
VIGEPDKFITLSRKRFPVLRATEGGIMLAAEGVPGERVTVRLFCPAGVPTVTGNVAVNTVPLEESGLCDLVFTLPEGGRAQVELSWK